MSTFRKTSIQEFNLRLKEIKTQLFDQIKSFEQRADVQTSLLQEINDFLKKRMEIDLDYSKQLDKLAKSTMVKQKNEKAKRSNWPIYSACTLWQQLVDDTREEATKRSISVNLCATRVVPNITILSSMLQRISKKCREICSMAQGELLRVLNELNVAMETYQVCFSQYNIVNMKLQRAQNAKDKVQNTGSVRKQRSIQKSFVKKTEKYEAARLKCSRARNEYLLCIEAANAAIYKYFADDLSDLVDCTNLGLDYWLGLILSNIISARKSVCQLEMNSLAELGSFKDSLQSPPDKHRFFENNNSTFMMPKLFDFKCESDESIKGISVDTRLLSEEFRQRQHQIKKRLSTLQSESESSWESMEQTEKYLRDLLNGSVSFELSESGLDNHVPLENSESELVKSYDVYLQNFNFYLLNANLIARLEARAEGIGSALLAVLSSSNQTEIESFGGSSGDRTNEISLSSDNLPRKKRIGSQTSTTNPKMVSQMESLGRRPRLFNGSLDEYCEITGEAIPLVVVSCVRVLSQYALHHQGLFRISGSQIEINNYRDAFENGDDPLADVNDASDANSIASTLKLYLREQQPPLFPFYLFDLLTDCVKCSSVNEFVNKISPLLNKLPRPTYLLLRYLFGFLRHLSEFSDENMMDPYNIAICFGPTLLPIPDGKDQVSYQNSVNEVVKSLIIHYELVFNPRIAGPRYERYSDIMLTPIDPPEIQDIFGDSVDDNFGSTPNESNTGCGMDTVSSANIFNYSDGSTHQLGSPTNSSMVCSINGQQLMGQRLFPQPSITKHQQNNPYVDRPDPDNNNGVPPSSTTFLQNQQSMTGKLSEEHQYAFPSGYFTADSDPHKDRQQEHQLHSAVYHTSPDKRFRKLDLNDNLSSSVIEGHKWRDQLPPSYNSPFCSPVMTERNFILTSPRVTSPRRNKGPAPDPPCSDLYSVINRPDRLRIPVAPKPVSRTVSEDISPPGASYQQISSNHSGEVFSPRAKISLMDGSLSARPSAADPDMNLGTQSNIVASSLRRSSIAVPETQELEKWSTAITGRQNSLVKGIAVSVIQNGSSSEATNIQPSTVPQKPHESSTMKLTTAWIKEKSHQNKNVPAGESSMGHSSKIDGHYQTE